jgi:hypothetical protein
MLSFLERGQVKTAAVYGCIKTTELNNVEETLLNLTWCVC